MQQIFFWSALVYWGAGFLLLWRIPALSGGQEDGVAARTVAKISVVIPARNEARNIGTLLESLSRQDAQPLEILVVDDQSTDETAEIARGCADSGVRVIEAAERPPGWTGKNWSCHCGASEARGALILFLDADTRLTSRDSLGRLAEEYRRRGGMISVQPYHVVKKAYEQLSAFFNLLAMIGSNAFSAWSKPGEATGCFGPCILMDMEAYRRIGGHEAVKSQVVDDLALCRLARGAGMAVHDYEGRSAISFRMYPGGLRDLVEGWTKNMALGAGLADPRAVILLVVWFAGMSNALLSVLTLFGSWTPAAGALILGTYALYVAQIWLQLRRVGSFRFAAALLFPVLFLFFVAIFLYSILRLKIFRSVSWKGRSIKL